ncbi:hypothetical protein Pan189_09440 [Stratiformator vulcanicus]|uniref:Uncharacterized protein n=1 Tax=Stratiformator vulcanicus TaxID=2527980 RepID=A0A517QYB2_9PLAN|nr:hypothetical protein Pan189_09440 [Stratiformator vulcanicus]
MNRRKRDTETAFAYITIRVALATVETCDLWHIESGQDAINCRLMRIRNATKGPNSLRQDDVAASGSLPVADRVKPIL